MEPQNPLPAPNNYGQYPVQQSDPLPPSMYPSTTPPPPKKSKKLLIAIATIVLLAGVGAAGAWYALSKKGGKTENVPMQAPQSNEKLTDKEAIQKAVDTYCQELGALYGFRDMKSGYIISDRFSEDILSDSPELLRFKQVGDAAAATVDCERSGEGMGIINDLLFAKKDDTWTYVDEVQNHAGTGFLCSVTDQYNVSKELVSACAPSEGARTQPR